jgi:lipopolysaccharide/colanic/teichoic acid biosynthesis glycosyltransferase
MLSVTTGLAVDARPSSSARSRFASHKQKRSSRARTGARRSRALHVFGEELFRTALGRERSRADRYGDTFAVVRVEVEFDNAEARTSALSAVGHALSALNRPHVVGWFTYGAVLGVILPGIEGSDPGPRLEQFGRKVVDRLGPNAAAGVSIRWHVHPGARSRTRQTALAPESVCYRSRPSRWAGTNDVLKRALDVLGSAALLVCLSPALLLIACLVKWCSPGPVLYRQVRIGQNGHPFEMLKFRTMRVNAAHDLHEQYVKWFIKSSGEAGRDPNHQLFKLTDDPRVTRIGRFLRRMSLDEVPQFWNVLVGDMSLVGPRPPLPYEVEHYQPWHCRRLLEAKPGITGLWQVKGRSRTTFDEMVRLDLHYARTHSLWTDIKILLATPRAVLSGNGAC